MKPTKMIRVIRVKDGCELNIADFIFKDYPNRFKLMSEEDKEKYKNDTGPKTARVAKENKPVETSPEHKAMVEKIEKARKQKEINAKRAATIARKKAEAEAEEQEEDE